MFHYPCQQRVKPPKSRPNNILFGEDQPADVELSDLPIVVVGGYINYAVAACVVLDNEKSLI